MKKPERSSYTPLDFQQWNESGGLVLSPKFQRRGVWTTPARSYLIDTILLGMPVPPIYLRVVQSPERKKVVREVIDGQQRISSVMDFVGGKFALSKSIESPYAGKKFSELDEGAQDRILHYPFICEMFYGIEDTEVLQIFARLNTHSVKLNAQELRNGKFFGPFKQSAYSLALEHIEFWRRHNIFTELKIARMREVELTSELLILEHSGLQDKKASVNNFYNKYDDVYSKRKLYASRFRTCMDVIENTCGQFLSSTEFRRPPLFYTLFSAVYHMRHGVPNYPAHLDIGGKTKSNNIESLGSAVRRLSEVIHSGKAGEPVAKSLQPFVNATLGQTDNINPRATRLDFLLTAAIGLK